MVGKNLTWLEKQLSIRAQIDAKNGNGINLNSSKNDKATPRIGESYLKLKSQYKNGIGKNEMEYSPKIGTWILGGIINVLNGEVPEEFKDKSFFSGIIKETSSSMNKKFKDIEEMINLYVINFEYNANQRIKDKIKIDPKETFQYLKNQKSKIDEKKEEKTKENTEENIPKYNNGINHINNGYNQIASYINENINKREYEKGLENLAKKIAKDECMKILVKHRMNINENNMVNYIISAMSVIKKEIDKFDEKYFKEEGGIDMNKTLTQYSKYLDFLIRGLDINKNI